MNFLTIFISDNGSFGCPGICSKNDTILKKIYLWETSTSKKLDKLNINRVTVKHVEWVTASWKIMKNMDARRYNFVYVAHFVKKKSVKGGIRTQIYEGYLTYSHFPNHA